MSEKLKNRLGFIGTLTISTILLFIYFGNILSAPNYVFFANGGDGLKSTFGSYYLMEYDSTYLHTDSQNYPFGESALFTGAQPIMVSGLKALKSIGIDFSENLVGILNVWTIFSIVLASLLLFLLLIKLNIDAWYAMLVSIIIAFLTPQIGRLGGHYDLAYVYFLPLYLLLLKQFFDKPSIQISVIIAFVSLFSLGTHAYFFAMYAFWIVFLMAYGYFMEKDRFGKIYKLVIHLFIQIVIPYIAFGMLTSSYPTDRTVFPWGFFATRSFPEAVFLPVGKPYGQFLHFSYLKWEGIAYIGLVATLTTLFLLYKFSRSIGFKQKPSLSKILNVTDNPFLNSILWGSIFALIISFAYPFQWHMEGLLKYTGPFKQFRAIGRFNWLFYYTINVVAFYLIWQFYKTKRNKLSSSILIIALLWGGYDSYLNCKNRENWINNKIPELEDTQNNLPQNKWLNDFKPDEFQTILAFPFFHIGSEVYWIENSQEMVKWAFVVSWKTGIPITDVMLSRTSISQTMKTMELYFDPLNEYGILNDYPNKKPVLLLIQNNAELNQNEQRFINYASLITQNDQYSAYKLPIDSIQKLNSDYRNTIVSEATSANITSEYQFTENTNQFIFKSFGNKIPDNFRENSVKTIKAKQVSILLDTALFDTTEMLSISFWMNGLNKDLIPRSMLKVGTKAEGEPWSQKIYTSIFKEVKYVNSDGWGLVEVNYTPAAPNESLRIEMWNDLVTGGDILIDDILIRPASMNIYFGGKDFAYKNNRFVALK